MSDGFDISSWDVDCFGHGQVRCPTPIVGHGASNGREADGWWPARPALPDSQCIHASAYAAPHEAAPGRRIHGFEAHC